MKITLIVGAITILALTLLYFAVQPQKIQNVNIEVDQQEAGTADQNTRIADPDTNETEAEQPTGKLKADTFSGTLEKVDTGCFSDGECFVEVDGKHVTALMGWSRTTVGSVIGVESFGDLEGHIGEEVEVYAQDNSDGTYTLYGSEGFYIKLK